MADRERRHKRSRQRERILELLRDTNDHPTADWIHGQLKKEFPGLSLATVYRNVNLLAEQGMITRIDFTGTTDRFDAETDLHYHFICERCGTITDLDLPVDKTLNEKAKRVTPFMVRRHRIEFFGLCDRCGEKGGA
jgi:Fur family transcriptional regulator, peroxide stress response regulator